MSTVVSGSYRLHHKTVSKHLLFLCSLFFFFQLLQAQSNIDGVILDN